MYHEARFEGFTMYKAYYDTIGEMPVKAKVYFPEQKEPVEMTAEEMYKLSDEGWYTIMHSVNYGVCDHWTSEPLKTWVDKRFNRINQYVDKKGNTVGYNRDEWSVHLTKDSNYWQSEVWNS